jgi:hypothetical protein
MTRAVIEVPAGESHIWFCMSRIAQFCGIAAMLLLTPARVAFASDCSCRRVSQTQRVHVRLVDMAGLLDGVETQAESIVRALFRRVGLELDFVEAAEKADFWMQIMKQRPLNLHRDTTGFAVLVRSERSSVSYAAVSLPTVEEASRELEAPVAEVLAVSMAHELGHLLLHSSAHSRSGIMKARLDRTQIELLERGELLFTKDEATKLVELARRLSPK